MKMSHNHTRNKRQRVKEATHRHLHELNDDDEEDWWSSCVWNGPPTLQAWRDLVVQWEQQRQRRRQTNDLFCSTLHRHILLHVGYVLSSSSDENNNDNRIDDNDELLMLLLETWRHLLLQTTNTSYAQTYTPCLDVDETLEALDLLTQAIVNTTTTATEPHHSRSHAAAILHHCVDIVELYLFKNGNDESNNQYRILQDRACHLPFLMCLIRGLASTGNRTTARAVKRKTMGLLKQLSQYPEESTCSFPTAGQILSTCGRLIWKTTDSESMDEDACPLDTKEQQLLHFGQDLLLKTESVDELQRISVIDDHDTLLFLRGLCCSSTCARRLSERTSVLHFLYITAVEKKADLRQLSCDAADCLSTIVMAMDNPTDRIVQLLMDIIVVCKDATSREVAMRALPGLTHVTQNPSNKTTSLRLLVERGPTLTPILQDMASFAKPVRGNNNNNGSHDTIRDAQLQAVELLCRVAEALPSFPTMTTSTCEPHFRTSRTTSTTTASLLETISTLLPTSSVAANHRMLTTIRHMQHNWDMDEESLASFTWSSSMLPTGVARVALEQHSICSTCSAAGTADSATLAMEILFHLIVPPRSSRHNNHRTTEAPFRHPSSQAVLLCLPRCPKVLEALIVVGSSSSSSSTATSRSTIRTAPATAREYAIQTLLILASIPFNRRVLAKQPGLLSCLIRHARTLTTTTTTTTDSRSSNQQQQQQEQQPGGWKDSNNDCNNNNNNKEALKRDILKLAAVL